MTQMGPHGEGGGVLQAQEDRAVRTKFFFRNLSSTRLLAAEVDLQTLAGLTGPTRRKPGEARKFDSRGPATPGIVLGLPLSPGRLGWQWLATMSTTRQQVRKREEIFCCCARQPALLLVLAHHFLSTATLLASLCRRVRGRRGRRTACWAPSGNGKLWSCRKLTAGSRLTAEMSLFFTPPCTTLSPTTAVKKLPDLRCRAGVIPIQGH